jgi:cytochrome c oxidase cbb3-type subunit 4
MMDLFGQFWGLYTVLMLVVFVGIWAWAWSGKRKKAFREAANLPFADEAPGSQEVSAKREERDS